MKLVAYGDSFTAGFNKSQDGTKRWYVTSFVEILAERLGIEFSNRAEAGSSNPQIAGQIQRDFECGLLNKEDHIFVGWSGLLRDYSFETHTDPRYHGWQNRRYRKPPPTKNAPVKEALSKTEGEKLYVGLQAIRATECFLRQNNFKYTMMSAFVNPPWIIDEQWDCWIEPQNTNNTMMDICYSAWLKPDQEEKPPWWTFNYHKYGEYYKHDEKNEGHDWRRHKGETRFLNVCRHPNAAGHELIANTLFPYFSERIK